MPLLNFATIALLVASHSIATTTPHEKAIAVSAATDSRSDNVRAQTQGAIASTGSTQPDDSNKARLIFWHSLLPMLRASKNARDRALSTQTDALSYELRDDDTSALGSRKVLAALLRGAAKAAPDDALVQWLWASALEDDSGCDARDPCPLRAHALLRLQPDNGLAWVPVFNEAWSSKDIATAASVLAKIAASKRFDEQNGAALNAWMDVFRRHPIPRIVIGKTISKLPIDMGTINFLMADDIAVLTGNPYYSFLMGACDRNAQSTLPESRFRDCARVGRLMMNGATTLKGRLVGRRLLGFSKEVNPADVENARVLTWQVQQGMNRQDKVAELKAHAADRMATDDEWEALKHQLSRAGVPMLPPPHWQPRFHGHVINPLDMPPHPEGL